MRAAVRQLAGQGPSAPRPRGRLLGWPQLSNRLRCLDWASAEGLRTGAGCRDLCGSHRWYGGTQIVQPAARHGENCACHNAATAVSARTLAPVAPRSGACPAERRRPISQRFPAANRPRAACTGVSRSIRAASAIRGTRCASHLLHWSGAGDGSRVGAGVCLSESAGLAARGCNGHTGEATEGST